MAAHRYWRLVGFAVAGAGPLELSEVQLYAGGARVGDTVVPTCPFAPASGALADLSDGLATGVVSWPASAHRAPGFALVWDLTGSGADVGALRLGSGNSANTFPLDFTVQYSDDGLVWAARRDYRGLAYPGGLGWTVDPAVGGVDPDFDKVVLLLHCDGVDGSTTFTDRSSIPKTVIPYGTVKVSTAESRFGGASARFSDVSARLSVSADSGFYFGSADFTIELFAWRDDLPGKYGHLFYLGDQQTFAFKHWGAKLYLYSAASGVLAMTPDAAFPALTMCHIALVRYSGTVKIYVDGVQAGVSTYTGALGSGTVAATFGAEASLAEFFAGYIDEVRVTNGLARYTANFAPPTATFPSNFLAPEAGTYLPRLRSADAIPSSMQGAAPPDGAASSHLREYAFFDAYHGGLGIIYGTVKEKNTPTNAPLRRKVWLMDERSGLAIRETWSDAATGAYEFRGIKQGVPYTVLAYDHAHNYRAFAGDNLLPDPMP